MHCVSSDLRFCSTLEEEICGQKSKEPHDIFQFFKKLYVCLLQEHIIYIHKHLGVFSYVLY